MTPEQDPQDVAAHAVSTALITYERAVEASTRHGVYVAWARVHECLCEALTLALLAGSGDDYLRRIVDRANDCLARWRRQAN